MRTFALSLLLLAGSGGAAVAAGTHGEVQDRIALLTSPDLRVRHAAEKALLAMGPSAVGPVLEVAAKGNLVEAEAARRLLPAFGPSHLAPLMQAARIDAALIYTREWREAVNATANMGTSVLPTIVSMLENENPFLSRFTFASQVLAAMGPESTDVLIPLLDSPKEKVRKQAASILAGRRDPRVKQAFLKALHNEDGGVRMYAARGLGSFNEEEVKTALLRTLRDPDWGPRRAAAAALGKMYEPRFRDVLARMARNEDDVLIRDTASNVLVYRSREPVGLRLGRRYAPYAISPVDEARESLRYAIFLLGTFGLLAMCSAVSVACRRFGYAWWVALFLVLLCARVGWAWGYELEKVSGRIEALLNVALVPAVACCGLVVVLIARSKLGALSVLALWMAPLLAFEAGYWLGWLKLWGRI